jgi:branched-chain amino acid aminotransferase
MSKAGANYMNSQLIRMEALVNGYSEGIALDVNGYVSEGPGENIFLVHKDRLYTPPLANSVLPGITRNTVLHIAQDLGIPVHEQAVPRELLYLADEVFFSGTAAEITPIRSVDKITVGNGKMGPISRALRAEFYAIANGKAEDRHGWLTPVPVKQAVAV